LATGVPTIKNPTATLSVRGYGRNAHHSWASVLRPNKEDFAQTLQAVSLRGLCSPQVAVE